MSFGANCKRALLPGRSTSPSRMRGSRILGGCPRPNLPDAYMPQLHKRLFSSSAIQNDPPAEIETTLTSSSEKETAVGVNLGAVVLQAQATPEPQQYKVPSLDTAQEEAPKTSAPAAIFVHCIGASSGHETAANLDTFCVPPTPHAPSSLSPQQNTRPRHVRTTVCRAEHATVLMRSSASRSRMNSGCGREATAPKSRPKHRMGDSPQPTVWAPIAVDRFSRFGGAMVEVSSISSTESVQNSYQHFVNWMASSSSSSSPSTSGRSGHHSRPTQFNVAWSPASPVPATATCDAVAISTPRPLYVDDQECTPMRHTQLSRRRFLEKVHASLRHLGKGACVSGCLKCCAPKTATCVHALARETTYGSGNDLSAILMAAAHAPATPPTAPRAAGSSSTTVPASTNMFGNASTGTSSKRLPDKSSTTTSTLPSPSRSWHSSSDGGGASLSGSSPVTFTFGARGNTARTDAADGASLSAFFVFSTFVGCGSSTAFDAKTASQRARAAATDCR
mmetsp:Transcript_22117/g.62184  ORF Transcript_22117/g.62184 Transcript_22117/m.62184 type:complete len:506 (+) Transcript_22117:1143-2660(+)